MALSLGGERTDQVLEDWLHRIHVSCSNPVVLRGGELTCEVNHSVGRVLMRAAELSAKYAQAPCPYRQALIQTIWRGTDWVVGESRARSLR